MFCCARLKMCGGRTHCSYDDRHHRDGEAQSKRRCAQGVPPSARGLSRAAARDARCAARRAEIGLTARVWSLGSLVHIGATRTAIPLPYQVLPALPGPERTRRPGHVVGMATLMPAPLAAPGRQAFRRRATHRHGHLPAGGTPAAIEDAPPHRALFPFRPHPSYARIAVVPGSGIERTFVSSHGRCGARLSNRAPGMPAR